MGFSRLVKRSRSKRKRHKPDRSKTRIRRRNTYPWQFTKKEFLELWSCGEEDLKKIEKTVLEIFPLPLKPGAPNNVEICKREDLLPRGGYSLSKSKTALRWNNEEGLAYAILIFRGEALMYGAIHPKYRQSDISEKVLTKAWEMGARRIVQTTTVPGLLVVHKIFTELAYKDGLDIPDCVVSEYPELQGIKNT